MPSIRAGTTQQSQPLPPSCLVTKSRSSPKGPKKKEVLENKTELTSLDSEYNQTQSNIDVMLVEITDDDATTKKFTKLNSLEAKIETNISKIETDIEFYSDNSTCPTCDQAINNKEEKVHSCTVKLKELNEGLDKLKAESDAVINRINIIKATQKRINELEQELVKLSTTSAKVKSYIRKLEKEIDEFKSTCDYKLSYINAVTKINVE